MSAQEQKKEKEKTNELNVFQDMNQTQTLLNA